MYSSYLRLWSRPRRNVSAGCLEVTDRSKVERLEERLLLSASYSLSVINPPLNSPDAQANAYGINDAGDVVGGSVVTVGDSGGGPSYYSGPFLFSDGVLTQLLSGGVFSDYSPAFATAINDAGTIVGQAQVGNSSTGNVFAPCYFSGGKPQLFGSNPDFGHGIALAINDSGEAVGQYEGGAAIFSQGSIVNFFDGYASGINDHGAIVGAFSIAESEQGYLYANGATTFLFANEVPTAINDAGEIVGQTGFTDDAFIDINGNMTDLGSGSALAVNDGGVVVGSSYVWGSESAFIYNGKLKDLNSLIPPDSGWTLVSATGINESGQICGDCVDPSGDHGAYLLTPDNKLNFKLQPTDTPGGVPITPITVEIDDTSDNVITTDQSEVTLDLDEGPDDTVDGTLTEPAVNGVATFADLSLGVAGTYTLKAIDGQDTPATSNPFNIGPVELDGFFQNGTSTATVDIGLTPTNGAGFVPLLEETNGAVVYADGDITASGIFTALQANLGAPLFTGTFTIPDGDTTTVLLNATPGVKIAGQQASFTSMTLTTGSGGTTYDSTIQLAGGLVLPPSLDAIPITLPASSPFVVGTGGLSISTGLIPVPDYSFELGGSIEITTADMSFQYSSGAGDLEVQGDFSIAFKTGASVASLTLNLAGSNFIDYEPDQSPSLKIIGTLTYADAIGIPFFGTWFSITGAKLSINTITDLVSGSLTLKAAKRSFTAGVSFLNGNLDSLDVQASGLQVPIDPGVTLNSITGGFSGLAPGDPKDLQVSGTLGFGLGFLVDVTCQQTLLFAQQEVTTAVSVDIADGTATGTGTLDLNFSAGSFGLSSVVFQAFSNTVSFEGFLTGSTAGVLSGSGTGTLTLPRFLGGGSVSETLTVYISASALRSQSYVSGSVQAGVLGSALLRFGFDGSVSVKFGKTAGTTARDLEGDALDISGDDLRTVNSEVNQGYDNGSWQGGGIYSSTAANDSGHLTAIGVVQNNQSGNALFTSNNTFDGSVPGAGDILVKYTYYGDANLDGKVDGSDYSLIDAGYGSDGLLTGWYNGDFNYDGVVDGTDYTLIDNAYNNQRPATGIFSLNASAGSPLEIPTSSGFPTVVVTNGLNIAENGQGWTGSLDITNNEVDVIKGSLSQVTSQARSGYALGGWSGPGLTSSTAAEDGSHLTGVGVVQNNQPGSLLFGSNNPFGSVVPDGSDILVKYTYAGDANLDGKIDGSDYSLIDAGYASHGSLTGWYNGDFNYDGVIDGSDYTLIDNAFNNQRTAFPSAKAAAVPATPAAAAVPAAIGMKKTSSAAKAVAASPAVPRGFYEPISQTVGTFSSQSLASLLGDTTDALDLFTVGKWAVIWPLRGRRRGLS
jgi:hypothetical protein